LKIISIILSFIILFSGYIPCNAGGSDCCTSSSEETVCLDTSNKLDTTSERDTDQQNEDCGPNCLCFCCASLYTLSKNILNLKDFQSFENQIDISKSNYQFSFNALVWNPPNV